MADNGRYKTLRWVRLIPTQLCAVDLPPTGRVSGNGDGMGAGWRGGRMNGSGEGYGPFSWDDYGDGWPYGISKGRGHGSGYGGHNGNNN